MRGKRRTEITIETRRVLVVRQSHRKIVDARCEACATDTPMISVESATAITGLSPRRLFREVEAGLIHFREMPDETLVLCLKSLSARMPQTGELFDSLI